MVVLERDGVSGVGEVLEHHFVGLVTGAPVDGDDIARADVVDSVVAGDLRLTLDGSRWTAVEVLRRSERH